MSLSFRILGCGSSGGVPRLDGNWGDCDPENPKNRRTRCSLLVQRTGKEGTTNVLIDTSPDMRNQLIDANVTWLDAILYSHDHADQTHGIDDVRAMVYAKQKRIEVWMDEATSQTLTSRFGYCFEQSAGTLYPAILKDNRIKTPYQEITVAGEGGTITATPFRQIHGNIDSLGFRFQNIAYSSDISDIPEESYPMLEGLECWVVDALRRAPHPTHFHLDKTLAEIERFKPKRAILTNLHVDMDYAQLCNELPKNIIPAFDGLEFD
ncbi:MAG: MBL fold metallo-hydrolase [Alphaproteobacteria bacterium]|nr:MBL fold metallo-hydrolase [Alphaproteobacteria bacterium]